MNIKDRLCILAVFAHPDDEVLFAGTITRAVFAGAEVHLVCLTKGEAGRICNEKTAWLQTMKTGEIRSAEYAESCARLKVFGHYVIGLPDGKASEWNTDDAALKVVEIIDKIKPTHVFGFNSSGGNGHPDHIASSVITKKACALRDLSMIQVTLFPKRMLRKLLRLFPKKIKQKAIRKAGIDDKLVSSVFKLNSKELKTKLSLLKIYASQFPDERNRYYGQPKFIFKIFARYEAFFEENGDTLDTLPQRVL